MIKKVKKSTTIDVGEYVNMTTGETLVSEVTGSNLTLTAKSDTNSIVISNEDYYVVDAKVLDYLSSILNRSELGSLSIMSTDLKTPLNIIYNNNVPHTNETLQQKLGMDSPSGFSKLIKKLMKVGILYQIKGNIMGQIRVIYMMNPFVVRKRKVIDATVLELFPNFHTKKL